MLTALQIVFILAAFVTSLGFVLVYLGWRRAFRIPPQSAAMETVTIIVAAHNEAVRIPRLLDALARQSHPADALRIILMDDRSSDGTADTARAHAGNLALRVLRIDDVPEGVSPKKWALHQGIRAADSEVLLFTDADCEPQEEWVAAMLRTLQREKDVAVGLAPLTQQHSTVSGYAAFESRRTMALMTAAAAWGLPYMATGRSWGFRREVYERCGGLEPLFAHLGGDDDLLLQRMHAHGARVGSCIEPDAQASSPTPDDWRTLSRQKLRHYRVSSAYRGKGAALLGVLLGAELLTMLTGIVLMVLLPGMQRLLPLLLMAWTLWYTSGFLVAPFKWMRGETSRLQLAKWEGFHIFYSVTLNLLSHLRPSRW